MGSYRNAMEILVEEEVARQVKLLPPRASTYINQVELVAYALNQLPALYATSERGLEYQLQRARAKFKDQVRQAVLRALAAIRRDPIRAYAPLQTPQQSAPLKDVLHQLRVVLRNDKIDWETLPKAIEVALRDRQPNGITWDARYGIAPNSPGSVPRRVPAPPPQTAYNLGLDASTDNELPASYRVSRPASPPPSPSRVEPPPERSTPRKGATRPTASKSDPSATNYGWDDPFYTI
jgi:Late competence development protein ComFB